VQETVRGDSDSLLSEPSAGEHCTTLTCEV
jgi:hypothetical protein